MKIPNLFPDDLDRYLFGDWRPAVGALFSTFHIVRIEDYKDFMNVPVAPHRREVYFFVYITNGHMIRSKNLTQHKIEKNGFYCLPAYQISSLEYISEDISGFYCHFTPEIFNHIQLSINIQRDFPFFDTLANPLIEIRNPDRIVTFLEHLYVEYKGYEIKRQIIISLLLASLFNELNMELKELRVKVKSRAQKITRDYKDVLSVHIEKIKQVADAGKMLNISPNHLNKSVKSVTGKTAYELLTDMKILQAKVLLKQTDLQVKEIAIKLGEFASSDFTRFFKKKTGVTPIEYRNDVKKTS